MINLTLKALVIYANCMLTLRYIPSWVIENQAAKVVFCSTLTLAKLLKYQDSFNIANDTHAQNDEAFDYARIEDNGSLHSDSHNLHEGLENYS